MSSRYDPSNRVDNPKIKVLKNKYPYFSRHCLKIRDKQGIIKPFTLNKAQRYVHARLEEQKRKTGKVRALLLKGRQQGMSTYVGGRFYHGSIFNPGATTFILSHQTKTTGPLFDIVKRYNDNMPAEIRPEVGASNKNQLKFERLQSEYTVGTAGNEDIGRGFTIKYLHGSEVAFYAKTDDLETGLFQAIADMDDTEIIFESTANGMGNMFYRKCMDALANKGEYQLIFVPWYWQDEYRARLCEDFTLTDQEMELKHLYGINDNQIMWRRNKIVDLKKEWKFQQEYPMNVMEAFVVSGESFYGKSDVMNARRCTLTDPSKPMILGIDCARTNDRTVFTLRRGREVVHYEAHNDLKAEGAEPTQQIISIAIKLINRFGVKKCFIDMGTGYGVVDGLKTLGYGDIVRGIYFQQEPADKVRAANKRAEMYLLSRDWFEDGPTNIPDDDDFFKDLMIIPPEFENTSSRKQIVPKAKIRKDAGVSTDITDSFVLTFAFPVKDDTIKQGRHRNERQNRTGQKPKSELQTVNRMRRRSGTVTTKSGITVKVSNF